MRGQSSPPFAVHGELALDGPIEAQPIFVSNDDPACEPRVWDLPSLAKAYAITHPATNSDNLCFASRAELRVHHDVGLRP